jgi:hypothetical protein
MAKAKRHARIAPTPADQAKDPVVYTLCKFWIWRRILLNEKSAKMQSVSDPILWNSHDISIL